MTTPATSWPSQISRAGLALAGLAITVAACTPSIEDYARELEAAICYREHECHAYERTGDCIDALFIDRDPQFAYLVRAATAGSVEYDPDAAAECLDAIRGLGCVDGTPTPEVCDRVFIGKVGRNEPCLETPECAGNAVCGYDPGCTDQCCVGACRVFADPLELGESCNFAGPPCEEGTYCRQDPITGSPTVCSEFVEPGGDCSSGQRCDEEGECRANRCRKIIYLPVGEVCDGSSTRCAEPASCRPGEDGQRCRLDPTLGTPCDPDYERCDRVDTYCDRASRLCTLRPAPGQPCGDVDCLPYASCEPVDGVFDEFGNNRRTCAYLPGPGDACEQYEPCLGELQCIEGSCSAPAQEPAKLCELP